MRGIILSLLLSIQYSISMASVDSIGIEKVGIQNYILHKVEKSEGLYGIARKYKTTVSAIQVANSLETTVLELNQILKVPTNSKVTISATTKVGPAIAKKNSQVQTHFVRKGETLFLIAKKYQVEVDQIMGWNDLSTKNLRIGQKLIVSPVGRIVEIQDIQEPKDITEEEKNKVIEGKSGTATSSVQTRPNSYLNSTDFSENGIAGWINDKTINPKKSIALHKTAPIGTIIRVTNSLNNKSVYVKVIGVLPATGDNENLCIVLSRAAATMLDVKEPKFRVQLNYAIPKE